MNNLPSYLTIATFGTAASKIQPDPTTYSGGYLAGQRFPAQHENYFMNGLTGNGNELISQVNNIQGELNNWLAQYSVSPNGTNTQIRDLFIARMALKLDSSAYTAADVLSKLLTVDTDTAGINATTLKSITIGQAGASYIPYVDASQNLVVNSTGFLSVGSSGVYSTAETVIAGRRAQNAKTVIEIDNQNNSASAYSGFRLDSFGSAWDILTGSTAANSNALDFNNGSVRVRITSGGNFLVGTTATNTGKVQILATGTAVPDGDTTDALVTFAVNRAFGQSSANVSIVANNSPGIDLGGSLGFGGNYGTTYANYGMIRGAKENATVGDFAGYLAFGTRTNGAQILERMRITSAGNVLVGTSTDSGYHFDVQSTADQQMQVVGKGAGWGGNILARFYTENTGAGVGKIIGAGSAYNPYTFSVLNSGLVWINRNTDDGSGAVLQVNGGISGNFLGTVATGVTGVTQASSDSSTKIATTAFVKSNFMQLKDSSTFSSSANFTANLVDQPSAPAIGGVVFIRVNRRNTDASGHFYDFYLPSGTYSYHITSSVSTTVGGTPTAFYTAGNGPNISGGGSILQELVASNSYIMVSGWIWRYS